MADGFKATLFSFALNGLIDETQTVTGLGDFPIKALILWGNVLSADGAGVHYETIFGVGTGASQQGMIAAFGRDDVSTSSEVRYKYNNKIIAVPDLGAIYGPVSLQSLGTGQFTLLFDDTLSGPIVNGIAIGGDDVSAFAGKFDVATGLGLQAITGLGLSPDSVVHLFNGLTSAQTSAADVEFCIGAMDRLFQGQYAFASQSAVSAFKVASYQTITSCLSRLDLTSALPLSVLLEAVYSSMDSDGFTINKTTNGLLVTNECLFLALKGVSVQAGSFNKRLSAGEQTVDTGSFTPEAWMFFTNDEAPLDTSQNSMRTTIGAAVSASAQACIWAGEEA